MERSRMGTQAAQGCPINQGQHWEQSMFARSLSFQLILLLNKCSRNFYQHLIHLQMAPASKQYFNARYPGLNILPDSVGKTHACIGAVQIKQGTNPPSANSDGEARYRVCATTDVRAVFLQP